MLSTKDKKIITSYLNSYTVPYCLAFPSKHEREKYRKPSLPEIVLVRLENYTNSSLTNGEIIIQHFHSIYVDNLAHDITYELTCMDDKIKNNKLLKFCGIYNSISKVVSVLKKEIKKMKKQIREEIDNLCFKMNHLYKCKCNLMDEQAKISMDTKYFKLVVDGNIRKIPFFEMMGRIDQQIEYIDKKMESIEHRVSDLKAKEEK